MPDIDFLGNKKDDDQEPKNQGNKKEKIAWSEPDKDKPLVKETPFRWLSSLTKKKETNQPAQAPKSAIDKNKIQKSRREILKLIKHNENSGLKEKKKSGQGWLARLIEKLKKQPSHNEVLIDYHKVFNQGKIDREPAARPADPAADRLSAAKFASSTRQTKSVSLPDPRSIGDFDEARATTKVEPVRQKEVKPEIPRPPAKPTGLASPAEAPARQAETLIKTTAKDKPSKPEEPVKIKPERLEVLETNLIKGEIITFFDWHKKIIIFINAILIPVFLIAVIYLGFMYYQKQTQLKIEEQAKKLDELKTEIKQAETDLKEITDFQAKLKIVSQIFSEHIYWTNFFKFFEDYTIKDVYYAGFSGDTSGDYLLDAIAKRYSNISEQVNILKNNEKITDVRTVGGEAISNDEAGEDSIKFNLNISILNSIFTE